MRRRTFQEGTSSSASIFFLECLFVSTRLIGPSGTRFLQQGEGTKAAKELQGGHGIHAHLESTLLHAAACAGTTAITPVDRVSDAVSRQREIRTNRRMWIEEGMTTGGVSVGSRRFNLNAAYFSTATDGSLSESSSLSPL
jgi:hypothetical protein